MYAMVTFRPLDPGAGITTSSLSIVRKADIDMALARAMEKLGFEVDGIEILDDDD